METPTPQWRQYGQGGDVIGAKRMRWSFRFFVIATLLSTFSLWYVENFMRHDLRETQYISSLTLHFESARPILRNIIANEERDGGEVTPKYLLALAAVEEEDIVLPTYERAFALTPSDTNLLINYGVQLFMADRFLEARDRFREAGIQAPDNALPRYLEAAALTASSIEEGKDPLESGALVDALALIERTNNRNTPIVFPKPLWHPTLPTDNHWYQMKRREIVSNTCSPLYTLQTIVIPRAINELEAGRTQNWDAWLETLQRMGARLVSPPNPGNEGSGVIRVQTGLKIQETAIRLRQRIHEMEGAPADESLADLAANIERAQEQLQAFEINREMAAKIHRSALTSPLKLAAFSMLIVTFAYIIA